MEKENKYVLQYPSIMKGKKIMYVHGFMSSAQSGTVARIREMLPSADVVAYDLPVHPQEAMDLLRQKCEEQKPDLIIGTSMGGMYTEMLYGYDRILVNPAFLMGETMTKHGMLGKQTFQNPRQDGVQEFIVTKSLVEEYKEVTRQCFAAVTDEEQDRVYGLFGDADTTVAAETYGVFAAHYRQAISFHGEHRLIDKSLIHAVIPVVRWIDDRQEGRERPIVYVSIDALRDARGSQRGKCDEGFPDSAQPLCDVCRSPVAKLRRGVCCRGAPLGQRHGECAGMAAPHLHQPGESALWRLSHRSRGGM